MWLLQRRALFNSSYNKPLFLWPMPSCFSLDKRPLPYCLSLHPEVASEQQISPLSSSLPSVHPRSQQLFAEYHMSPLGEEEEGRERGDKGEGKSYPNGKRTSLLLLSSPPFTFAPRLSWVCVLHCCRVSSWNRRQVQQKSMV